MTLAPAPPFDCQFLQPFHAYISGVLETEQDRSQADIR